MEVGGIVTRDTGIEGAVGGGAGSDCGCSIGSNLVPVIFLIVPALTCPFLARTDGTPL